MNIAPARLEPIYSPRIWGERSLAPLYPEKTNLAEPIGEAWLTARESRFADGPYAGDTLGEAWKKMPAEWKGQSAAAFVEFPLLVKFLFPAEKLSVQVHPDDDYASRRETAAGDRGKTEMWYVVAAEPGAAVWSGLREDVTAEKFRRAIAGGKAEELVARIPVKTGDAIFCPAGTVHYIGPGMILCEIQEYSDITYRVYDYGRKGSDGKPRALHLEKAFDVIRFGKQKGGKLEPVRIRRNSIDETYFVVCQYFAVESAEFARELSMMKTPDFFDIQIVLDGRGTIEHSGGKHAYAPGQAWFFPAGRHEFRFVAGAPTKLLRAYVPKDLDDFARTMRDDRIAQSEWSRLVQR